MSDQNARARPDPEAAKVAAFQVRGRFLTALAIRIDTDTPDDAFYGQLDDQLQRMPQFFLGAPVVLDLVNAPKGSNEGTIRDLVDNLRGRGLRVFGVQNAELDAETLQKLGLIPLSGGRDAPLPRDASPAPAAAEPQSEVPVPVQNKVIRAPVRSGQMVVAEEGDLTIIGSVASGAELIAAGNIHVYGTMRGRAMAGCHGDTEAHIFCQSLDAELLAIAGLYQTNEALDGTAKKRCTHIYLKDDKLCMEVIA